jgi:PAS domain S-box-containing protein
MEGQVQSELQHLHWIYELTEAVSHAEALETIYEVSLKTIQQVLFADRASILLYDPDGVMRFKAWKGLSSQYRQATEGHTPWKPDTPNPQSILVADVKQEASLASLRKVIVNEGIRALAFIPLTYLGRVVGKFMVYYDHPHAFETVEVQLAETIAHQVAFAIERKRVEDQLRLGQQQLTDFVENASVGLNWIGPDGRILWANRTELDLLGYMAEEYIGHHIAEFHADEVVVKDFLHRLITKETLHGYEAQLKCKDGSIKDVVINSNVLWDDDTFIHTRCFTHDITALKQGQAAQAHLAAIVDGSGVAIISKNVNGIITSWNSAAQRMYGYQAQEVIGQHIGLLVPSDRSTEIPDTWERLKRGERLEHFETQRLHKNGTILDVSLTISPIYNNIGQLIGASKIARDITARKRTEQLQGLLDEISELLLLTFDCENVLHEVAKRCVPMLGDWCSIHVVQPDGRLHTTDMVASESAILTTLRELRDKYPFDPNGKTGLAHALRTGEPLFLPELSSEILETHARSNEHLALIRQLGTQSAILVPLHARNRTLGVLSLNISGSQRRYNSEDFAVAKELARRAALAIDNADLYQKAHQAQQIAEVAVERTSQLQIVTSALSSVASPGEVASIILSQGLATLRATAGAITRFTEDVTMLEIVDAAGYPSELIERWRRFSINEPIMLAEAVRTGQPLWLGSREIMKTEYPLLRTIDSASEAIAVVPLKVSGRTIGGWVLSFNTPQEFNDEDCAFMLALAQQGAQALERAYLYAQVQFHAEGLEQQVQERTEELYQALLRAQNADRVKSIMLANVSHEMRTPLSSIIGFSDLLLQRAPAPAKAQEYISFINSEGKRLAQLINDFLDLQRLEQGLKALRYAPVDLALLITSTIQTHQLDQDEQHPLRLALTPISTLYADEARLQQVILNLIGNAIKYSPKGGAIEIAVRQERQDVVFSIHDEGLGIPGEELEHLFEQFYRGTAAEELRIKGTGLGLALCKEIIQAHQGRIWVESGGIGRGSTFRFAIPLHASREEPW